MPFSSESGKWATDRALARLVPHLRDENKDGMLSVLDIGVGSGTYSNRYRQGVLKNANWTGIEVWAPYIEKYALNTLYDKIVQQDARTYAKEMSAEYGSKSIPHFDLVFLGDVVEHMSKEDAQEMVSNLLYISNVVIISIPVVHYPQGAYEGNPFEEHVKDDWSDAEVHETWGNFIVQGYVENEIGVYVLNSEKCTRSEVMEDWLAPKIGVYGISKNEEQLIQRWAEQLNFAFEQNFIHQALLLDTGSTDKTCDIAEGTCSRLQVIDGLIVPWRFDEAKTTSLALLGETDLAVSIDIDEYVPMSSWKALKSYLQNSLRTTGCLPDRINHSFSTVWDWQDLELLEKGDEESRNFSSHYHDRIHSRFNWMWSLPVHEILEWKNMEVAPRIDFCTDFLMIQKPLTKDGRSSYLSLLEMSVKERPDVWKSWSFLAQEYLAVGRNDDALAAVENAEQQKDADRGYLYYLKSFIYYDPLRGLGALIQAALTDNIREYDIAVAEKALYLGDVATARRHLERAKAMTQRSNGYKLNLAVWGEEGEAYLNNLEHRVSQAEAESESESAFSAVKDLNYRPAPVPVKFE